MININKELTPYNFSYLANKDNKYIVIHYVGEVSTAKNNVDYYASKSLNASAHYFVDENEIWQSVEDSNVAWHCGGALQGTEGHTLHGICLNSNSIGIEMCVKRDKKGNWYFEEGTISNTIELVKYLMDKYDIPVDRVVRHYDVTGKYCPAPLVNEDTWKEFKDMITAIEEYTSINDIVWELSHRGIVTDKEGMIREMKMSPNGRLYWLARKCVQYIREKD